MNEDIKAPGDTKTVNGAQTEVASRSSKDADQGTNKIVDLGQTTGSLWAEQQEQYAKIMKEQDPTFKVTSAFDELEKTRKTGSVLHDADAKKAALLQTDVKKSDADVKSASKDALAADKKVAEMEQAAIDAEHEGSVLYDAEAKKQALLGGNPAAAKSNVKAGQAAPKADK